MEEQKLVGVVPLYAFFIGVVLSVIALWRNFNNDLPLIWGGLSSGSSFVDILIAMSFYVTAFGACALYLWLRDRNNPSREVGPAQFALILYGVSAVILLGAFLT